MEDEVRHNIEEFGWHVMMVDSDEEGPGFVYTIGLWKTLQVPELICVGLKLDVMHAMVNELGERRRKGEIVVPGEPVQGLVSNFPCVLKTMAMKHYEAYLGYAIWYYDGNQFPVEQIVWPDRSARFPWDVGYDAPPTQQPRLY
jgi:hypothetical protein